MNKEIKDGKLEKSLFQLCIYNLESPSIAKNLKNEKFWHFCSQFEGFYFLSSTFFWFQNMRSQFLRSQKSLLGFPT
ncbi:hypothetical protein [Pseudanabaena sp. BC1403]|uniref:hypothetical protein n=1 Tax=Pseudanabaena sp. BC1403 TaxID=2043171 RepID=UPI0015E1B44E|nr:hypothetical protein [Pseudanabaena sp. BC1403]